MDTPPSQVSRGSLFWPLFVIAVVAVLAVIGWLVLPKNGDDRPTDKLILRREKDSEKFTRDETLKLMDLRNQAIGYLENHDFSDADAALDAILSKTPRDPFATRNLAICRQLAFKAIDRQQYPENYADSERIAKYAIHRAIEIEPDSFIPRVIAARVAETADQLDEAIANLQEARRLGPEAVGPAYDLYLLSQMVPEADEEGFNALRFVFQKEPGNLAVLKEWLPAVASRHGQELIEALNRAKETIGPFVETIKIHTRQDLRQFLDAALTAADEKRWPDAERAVRLLKNLMLSESARDSRYVMLDSLEYIVLDFSKETQRRLDLPPAQVSASRPIHFLRPDDPAALPNVGECQDLCITDFDLEGSPDLIVLRKDQLTAYGRKPNLPAWNPIASVKLDGAYVGMLAYDFDDDVDQQILQAIVELNKPDRKKDDTAGSRLCHTADPDAILFGPAGLMLFENRKDPKDGARSLVAVTGGESFDAIRDVNAATAADIDSDGDLDLVVSHGGGIRVFSNRGNLTFEDISARSLLPSATNRVTAMAIVDWDKDSDVDIVLATAAGAGLLENVRHGRLRYRELNGFSQLRQAHSLRIGDFDGDGSWDVASDGPKGTNVVFTQRTQAGLVSERRSISLDSTPVRSIRTGDFDNDGVLDLLTLKEEGVTIWRGNGAMGFEPNLRITDDWMRNAKVVGVRDLDQDGDLDLIVAGTTEIGELSNQCQEKDNSDHGWTEFRLIAMQVKHGEQNWEKRTNHINLGGVIELRSGERYQASVVTDPLTHFGLAKQRHADVARIIWTNGIPSNVLNPAADVTACIEQKLLGSCPYLYTWNGKRFEFVTDLLWNAPLGLKFAETVVAPWREWEYLKIDGRQLKENRGEYQLRITAELWEAEYFDQVKLFAVDHPAGTEIYTNEKVGPAEIAEPQIHTVRSPRKPVAARDTKGRDVLAQVIACDGDYTKTFDKRIAQGFTEEHFLELDLGDFPEGKKITLFLTGWMYPGSTSLRVQLSQNPDLPKSKTPSIQVPDADGKWREAVAYMGFPGGKTKTIAVDVSGLFANGDHRLRIVSNMELFWDAAFFTVDDQAVTVRETELKLVRAELRDRGGVSARSWPAAGHGPDQFDYNNLVPGEAWPAMDGHFTRYGDVLPLLTTRDDQLVVTGSGDEIQLSFAVPAEPLEPGWVRDFVIYTVGWDKDADQNTTYGECVEPLPFEGMTVYALRDGEPRQLDAAYAEYLRTYQTRKKNPSLFWKSVQQSKQ